MVSIAPAPATTGSGRLINPGRLITAHRNTGHLMITSGRSLCRPDRDPAERFLPPANPAVASMATQGMPTPEEIPSGDNTMNRTIKSALIVAAICSALSLSACVADGYYAGGSYYSSYPYYSRPYLYPSSGAYLYYSSPRYRPYYHHHHRPHYNRPGRPHYNRPGRPHYNRPGRPPHHRPGRPQSNRPPQGGTHRPRR
ncbi:hypothetical protein Maes01_01836 [Microbulbifer aestuariivivens]|uniref:Lipoprotein n=2 Tax=Microbulbifer aestuariivivens TaxID=1908308 RepID=A0ABP9WPZ3_9GAMM